MVTKAVTSVDQYLSDLPEDRRRAVSLARDLILLHLPDGYRESINWGMIAYEIPLERYPHSYNGQPLGYIALASQKHHVALYLLGPYLDPAQHRLLKTEFAKAGKKLDMGKSCLRFQTLEDLAVPAVAQVIASMPPDRYIEQYEAVRAAQSKVKTRTASPQKAKKTRARAAAPRAASRSAAKKTKAKATRSKAKAKNAPRRRS